MRIAFVADEATRDRIERVKKARGIRSTSDLLRYLIAVAAEDVERRPAHSGNGSRREVDGE